MAQMIIGELFLHLSAVLSICLAAGILISISRKVSGFFPRSLVVMMFGFVPISIYHLLEASEFFGIHVLPPEGTLAHITIDHVMTVIAMLTFAGFMYRFKRNYCDPIYAAKQRMQRTER